MTKNAKGGTLARDPRPSRVTSCRPDHITAGAGVQPLGDGITGAQLASALLGVQIHGLEITMGYRGKEQFILVVGDVQEDVEITFAQLRSQNRTADRILEMTGLLPAYLKKDADGGEPWRRAVAALIQEARND